ncbi:zinc finger protein 638 isoform X2 [Lacerta agilis]|uniref:zinc finger protein 638 isoform X2 n=1 Tax=Lacerta agilis TaxID=80427 RepID=UPI001419EDC1|nr:zinc finger protein 638 isoform X2 [Lacerta agilis]
MQDGRKAASTKGNRAPSDEAAAQHPLDPLRRFVVFLENFAPFVNSLNLGIASPLLLGPPPPPPLQLAQIKTQLAFHQLNSVASTHSIASYALLNEAFLKIAMFNPRGNMPPRPRGPNAPGQLPRGPFPGPGPGPDCHQRQHPSAPPRMPQRVMEPEMRARFPRPNVQVTQHGMDPRQERHQKEGGHAAHWDNPFPPVHSSQMTSGKFAEQATRIQNRYTTESASSILASFGLSNEDLEELSRYPDDQLTPENMPLILRDIRMRKMTHQLPSLPSQSTEKEMFHSDDGCGTMVKSKVIDYGHESKYEYTEAPLEVKVYNSDASTEGSVKGFPTQQTALVSSALSGVTSSQMNAVEELIRKMGFQRSTPSTQSFFPMDASNKGPGLGLPPAGAGMPPAAPPMMSPVVPSMSGVPVLPGMPPVVPQTLPPPTVPQPMMPPVNQPPPTMYQPPPPFAPEMLEGVNQRDTFHHESRAHPSDVPHGPASGQKKPHKKPQHPIESPFGVVKASWLPVFSQADAQKLKRLPTPSMMNDYYAASPRIFPHACSLCNVECRHLKDWIQHQNSTTHIENCRQLRQQFPDWNPEAYSSSSKRHESDRKENHTPRRRSCSSSPKRSRRSSSGHAWRRSRSRSRSPGRRRPRSRSPRYRHGPRYRSRSPRRPHLSSSHYRRSYSKERGSRRSTRSPGKDLEEAVKCLGPSFVEEYNKQKSLQALSRGCALKSIPLEPEKTPGSVKKTPSHSTAPPKSVKKDLPPGSSDIDVPNKDGVVAEETNVSQPTPCSQILTDKALSCGTVLRISDLPDDGYTDNDIKKIVQPFGKVSNILVLRAKNEAFLEMNYKEAVTAAVKYGETAPVLVNGRRVKISVAEKSKVDPSLNKGNEKKPSQSIKKAPVGAQLVKPPPDSQNAKKAPPSPKDVKKASPSTQNVKKAPSGTQSVKKAPSGTQSVKKAPSGTQSVKKAASGTQSVKKAASGTQSVKKPSSTSQNVKKAPGSQDAKKPSTTSQNVKKAPSSSQNVKNSLASATKDQTAAKKSSAAVSLATASNDDKKSGDSRKAGETKVAVKPKKAADLKKTTGAKTGVKQKKPTDPKKPDGVPKAAGSKVTAEPKTAVKSKANETGGTKAAVKPKNPQSGSKKPEEATKAVESEKTSEPEAALKSKPKETSLPAEVPDVTEVAKNIEASESVTKEAEEMCVVSISNLPPSGLTPDEISNLTKPFGKVKDMLIVSSHKKAYLEMGCKTAESMVQFYTCFPMYVEQNQLSITLAPEFKDIKDEAILQLDSAESAASMCRFLKRYPHSLGKSRLTFSRSPQIEPTPAEVTRKEEMKQEPGNESPDLNTFPEGSGVVHPAAVPSPKPPEAKEEPSSDQKPRIPEGKTEEDSRPIEKVVCEVASEPSKTEGSEEDSGVGATTTPTMPVDLGLPEVKSERVLTLPSNLEKEEKITDPSNDEFLENAPAAAGENKSEELATPVGKPREELPSMTEAESIGVDSVTTVEGEDIVAATSETFPVDSAEVAVEEVSSGDVQSDNKPITQEADSTEASLNISEIPTYQVIGGVIDKESEIPCSTAEANIVVESEAAALEAVEVTEEKPELHVVKTETTLEKQPERLVSNDGPTKEEKPEKNTDDKIPEQILPKAQPSKGPGKAAESVSLASESASSVETTSVSESTLKTLVSVPNVSKTRASTPRKEEQNPPAKLATRSRTVAEKKVVSKEASQQRPPSGRSNLTDGGKPKANVRSLVKLGIGKSSPLPDKDSPVETKGSSKQTPERESRSSSVKRDSGSNKVPAGRTTRSSKSCTKPKEEEELSPFNLGEFVTMDEVLEEADSPTQPRRNPVRGKRKDHAKKSLPSEPSSKKRKAKSSAHVDENELSFVTLDEIGEDEGGMLQAELLNLEAVPDSQTLVTVDEVNDEEELMDEAIKDPQSLVTLDEISEQEDPKDAFALGDNESDLKAEPLVTVDEIGEVEEIPLSELSQFKVDETIKSRAGEKQVVEDPGEDPGDFLSSQIPEDPSTLVTVDEIHEDIDDQPLVTLDEVAEDDEDFLADFNRLKEDFNFVTVDEVGSEDEEEGKSDSPPPAEMKESVAESISGEEVVMAVAEPEEDVAKSEEVGTPGESLAEKREQASKEQLEGTEAQAEEPQEETCISVVATVDKPAALTDTEKDEGRDEETSQAPEADTGCEQPVAEPVLNQAEMPDSESSMREDQQPSEPDSLGEGAVAGEADTEVEESSASTASEEKTGENVQMPSSDVSVSVVDSQAVDTAELDTKSEPQDQVPSADLKEESCSEVTSSQPSEKPEKDLSDSECEEPESKRRKIDSSETGKAPSQLKDLDFLVPKAGFFCQICSCFCVDEASMKTHCQSQLHQENMEKFMIKSTAEEKKKEGDGEAEEQSSR